MLVIDAVGEVFQTLKLDLAQLVVNFGGAVLKLERRHRAPQKTILLTPVTTLRDRRQHRDVLVPALRIVAINKIGGPDETVLAHSLLVREVMKHQHALAESIRTDFK